MHDIPRIVHVAWPSKDLLDSDHPLIVNGLGRLRELNPDWKIVISDDQDIDQYLKKSLNARDYDLIKDRHVVEKSDLWRLFKIHQEGGLYVDVDRFCNRCLNDVIGPGIRWVLPTCLDNDFSQDIMLSAPENPAFYQAITLSIQRRRGQQNSIYFLGPQTYMHAVTKTLLGRMIDSYPGADTFDQIRQHISHLDFVRVYREYPPYDTVIYQHDQDHAQDWETLKRSFYAQSGLKHWSGQW